MNLKMPDHVYYSQSLHELRRIRRGWAKAMNQAKTPEGAEAARQKVEQADRRIRARQSICLRLAMPKKQQRKLGILPPVQEPTIRKNQMVEAVAETATASNPLYENR